MDCTHNHVYRGVTSALCCDHSINKLLLQNSEREKPHSEETNQHAQHVASPFHSFVTISMHPHKPHATSQPLLVSPTHTKLFMHNTYIKWKPNTAQLASTPEASHKWVHTLKVCKMACCRCWSRWSATGAVACVPDRQAALHMPAPFKTVAPLVSVLVPQGYRWVKYARYAVDVRSWADGARL